MVAMLIMSSCAEDKETGASIGRIYGVVTNKSTGEPVIAGSVELVVFNSTDYYDYSVLTRTVTGADGHYEFNDLTPRDNYGVIVVSEGYETQVYKLIVEAGKTTSGDILLAPKAVVVVPTYLSVVTQPVSDIKGTSACVIITYTRAYDYVDPRDGQGDGSSNNGSYTSTRPTTGGFYWGTDADPITKGAKVSVSAMWVNPYTQGYERVLTGLTTNTTYYVQGFATNAIGTEYGTVESFTTKKSDD